MTDCALPLLSVLHATEADSLRPVVARRHEEQLAVLVVPVGLREVPDGALRLIMISTAQNRRTRVVVDVLICPLPYIAHHVLTPKGLAPRGCASTSLAAPITRPLSGTGAGASAGSFCHGHAYIPPARPAPASRSCPRGRCGRHCPAPRIAIPIHAEGACRPISRRRAHLPARPR